MSALHTHINKLVIIIPTVNGKCLRQTNWRQVRVPATQRPTVLFLHSPTNGHTIIVFVSREIYKYAHVCVYELARVWRTCSVDGTLQAAYQSASAQQRPTSSSFSGSDSGLIEKKNKTTIYESSYMYVCVCMDHPLEWEKLLPTNCDKSPTVLSSVPSVSICQPPSAHKPH